MKTQLVKLSKAAGWISLILGLIHSSATIVIIKQLPALPENFRSTFLFMYIAAGLSCILAGAIMLLSVNREIQCMKISAYLFLAPSLFMLILGIGAPLAMSDNPFGYLSLVIGVFSFTTGILRLRDFQNRQAKID